MSAAIHSSLAILLSDVNNRETQRQNVHSAARTHPQATVAEQFRKGSANFINQAITASNLGAMVQMGNDHIAPNFYSRIDNYVPAHPFAEYVENLRRFKVEFPTSECGPLDADVEVDDKPGRAIVYQLLEITGHSLRLRRLSICMLHWIRKKRSWRAYQCPTVRGLSGTGILGDL